MNAANFPTPKNLRDKRVLVLGLGISGLAMAQWSRFCGARVVVQDTRAEPLHKAKWLEICASSNEKTEEVLLHCALDAAEFQAHIQAQKYDWVLPSPGITPADLAPVLNLVRACGGEVSCELTLWSEAIETLREQWRYAPKIIAITGTNGKTTVTRLTQFLITNAPRDTNATRAVNAVVAGNIAPSLLDVLLGCAHAVTLPDVWVLELSSFQLHFAKNFQPDAAVILNITQDHLDWHDDMASYIQDKYKVYGMKPAATRVIAVRGEREFPDPITPWRSVGADAPQAAGQLGLVQQPSSKIRRVFIAQQEDAGLNMLLPVEELKIHGEHNYVNAQVALSLAESTGLRLPDVLPVLRRYLGEAHRMEVIAQKAGVDFVDDSKGTNVGASLAALNSYAAEGRKVALILGGVGKGQDFAPLQGAIAACTVAIAFIGLDGEKIAAQVLEAPINPNPNPAASAAASVFAPVLIDTKRNNETNDNNEKSKRLHKIEKKHASSLPEAVAWCAQKAQPGMVVLLSPACASFDMFRDYAHRGLVFRQAVEALQ